MKTETIIYDDGTEPTTINRFCCDGMCNQGRVCAGAPAPAEACTEMGIDDAPETLGTLVLAGALVVVVVGMVAFLAGYFL